MKAVALFANIQSCWADQYSSIDTLNIKIGPLVIILWQNILGQPQIALNSLLTTLPNRNSNFEAHGGHILYLAQLDYFAYWAYFAYLAYFCIFWLFWPILLILAYFCIFCLFWPILCILAYFCLFCLLWPILQIFAYCKPQGADKPTRGKLLGLTMFCHQLQGFRLSGLRPSTFSYYKPQGVDKPNRGIVTWANYVPSSVTGL